MKGSNFIVMLVGTAFVAACGTNREGVAVSAMNPLPTARTPVVMPEDQAWRSLNSVERDLATVPGGGSASARQGEASAVQYARSPGTAAQNSASVTVRSNGTYVAATADETSATVRRILPPGSRNDGTSISVSTGAGSAGGPGISDGLGRSIESNVRDSVGAAVDAARDSTRGSQSRSTTETVSSNHNRSSQTNETRSANSVSHSSSSNQSASVSETHSSVR